MKNKKEIIIKWILGILTFILIMYISFGLMFLSIFNVSKKILNKDSVSNFISNINITDILKDELGNELKEFTLIKEDLINIGISSDGIDNFVNSKDVKDFSSNVITNIFDKISNHNNTNYKITNEEVIKLFEDNIDKLDISSNNSESQILNKIKDKIPNLVLNINELIDKLCDKLENSGIFQKYQNYIFKSIDALDLISGIVLFIITFMIVTFLILLIFIRRNIYKSLKWLSISFIIPSSILAIINVLISRIMHTNNALIKSIIDVVSKDLKYNSIVYLIISLVLIIINIIWYIIKKYKSKKVISVEEKAHKNN